MYFSVIRFYHTPREISFIFIRWNSDCCSYGCKMLSSSSRFTCSWWMWWVHLQNARFQSNVGLLLEMLAGWHPDPKREALNLSPPSCWLRLQPGPWAPRLLPSELPGHFKACSGQVPGCPPLTSAEQLGASLVAGVGTRGQAFLQQSCPQGQILWAFMAHTCVRWGCVPASSWQRGAALCME